jgi:predicted nucleic acid-binding protein
VLVSAAIAGGPPRRILALAERGRIELVVPDLVEVELIRVLRDKRRWRPARIEAFQAQFDGAVADTPAAPDRAEPLSGNPADDRILACAVKNRVDVLVSGNRRHLLPLGSSHGVRILTPQELLAELRRRR